MSDPTDWAGRMVMAVCSVAAVAVVVFAVLSIVNTGPISAANQREYNHDVAKVERFCGQDVADAFRELGDKDNDNSGRADEWVKTCLLAPDQIGTLR